MFALLATKAANMKFTTLTFLLFITTPIFSQANLYEGLPVFHGAKITGNYPNTEFTFTVPATGERPINFTAENLPKGLRIDPSNGIIRGNVVEKGSYTVKIIATNTKGKHKSQRTNHWLRVNKMELLSIVLALVNMGLAKRSGTSSVVPQF